MWHATLRHATRLVCCLVLLPSHQSSEGFSVESNKMSWSQEKTVEFIKEYRKLVVLWDIRLEEYKNNHGKLGAQRKLAKRFDCDVAMVKKKIKNLRTAFRREHRGVTKKKSESSPIKRSKWFAYDLLMFLVDVDSSRPGCSSQVESQTDQPACDEVSYY